MFSRQSTSLSHGSESSDKHMVNERDRWREIGRKGLTLQRRQQNEQQQAQMKRALQHFGGFVPHVLHLQILRDMVTNGHRPQFDGRTRTLQGAVLFADASGFTALTSRLAQEESGAEKMCTAMNRFFALMISQTHAWGGDIVKFAGDALQILFEVGDSAECGAHCSPDMATAVHRALHCARGMHEDLAGYVAFEGTGGADKGLGLTVHIGVGCGSMTALHLGGVFGRYEYVLVGAPLDQVRIAEPLAKPGETVLAPQAQQHVASLVESEEVAVPGFHALRRLKEELPRPEIPVVTIPTNINTALLISRYIPAAVDRKLRSGYDGLIAELREVSVLFIEVSGLDLSVEGTGDAAASHSAGQKLMLAVQKHLFLQEGSINKMMMDDKGLIILAVLGLPPLPHDNDSERAVRAALAMVSHLGPELGPGVTCSVGVSSGQAFCGVIGDMMRREYTVMGDMVNLGARLMSSAPADGVYVDENTYKLTRAIFKYEVIEGLELKGKGTVRVYRPTGDTEGAGPVHSTGVMGRKHEVQQIRNTLATLYTYSGTGVMMIAGDPGSGREAIVRALVRTAASEGRMLVLRKPKNGDGAGSSQSPTRTALSLRPGRSKRNTETDEIEMALIDKLYAAWHPVVLSLVAQVCTAAATQASTVDVVRQLLSPEYRKHLPDLITLIPGLCDTDAALVPEANVEGYEPVAPGRQEEVLGLMIRDMLQNVRRESDVLVIIQLESGSGTRNNVDRSSWKLAHTVWKEAAQQKRGRHAFLLAIISNCIVRLDSQSLEVAETLSAVEEADTLVNLHPFDRVGRDQYLVDLLSAVYKYQQSLEQVPKCLLDFVSDIASGVPLYIELLVGLMINQGLVKIVELGLAQGAINGLEVDASLLGYHSQMDAAEVDAIIAVPHKIVTGTRLKYDRLEPTKQLLLQCTSLMPGFSIQMVRELAVHLEYGQQALDRLEGDLAELVENRVFDPVPVADEFVLSHDPHAKSAYRYQSRLLQFEIGKMVMPSARDKMMACIVAMKGSAEMKLARSLEMKRQEQMDVLDLRRSSAGFRGRRKSKRLFGMKRRSSIAPGPPRERKPAGRLSSVLFRRQSKRVSQESACRESAAAAPLQARETGGGRASSLAMPALAEIVEDMACSVDADGAPQAGRAHPMRRVSRSSSITSMVPVDVVEELEALRAENATLRARRSRMCAIM